MSHGKFLFVAILAVFMAACTRPMSTPPPVLSEEQRQTLTARAPTATPTETPEPTATRTATATPTDTATETPQPIFEDLPSDHPSREQVEFAYNEGYLVPCGQNPLMICPDDPVTALEWAIAAVRITDSDFDPNEPSANFLTPVPEITYEYLNSPNARGHVPSEEAQAYVRRFIELGFYTPALQCNRQNPTTFCPDQPINQEQGEALIANVLSAVETGTSTGGG